MLNARDARWFEKPGQGHSLPLTGGDEYEAETFFPARLDELDPVTRQGTVRLNV